MRLSEDDRRKLQEIIEGLDDTALEEYGEFVESLDAMMANVELTITSLFIVRAEQFRRKREARLYGPLSDCIPF